MKHQRGRTVENRAHELNSTRKGEEFTRRARDPEQLPRLAILVMKATKEKWNI